MAAGEGAIAGLLTRRGARARRVRALELGFQGLLLLMLLTSLAFLLVLLGDVLVKAIPVFRERGTDVLTSGLAARASQAGVWQGIKGSFLLAVITAVVAFPVGIASAVYLEEYARDTRLTRFIDVNIRNLAGVPSVVYGLLGLAIFVRFLGSGGMANLTGGSTVLSGGLTLAVLVLPIVIITSAEAIRAVPASLRRGGYGLGATRWQTIRELVLPQAAPGILTGTILSLARAIGETAPLIVVGAITGYLSTGEAGLIASLRERFTALPMIVFDWARQPRAEFTQELAPVAIVVLLAFTLTANAAAIMLRQRFQRRR